MVDSFLCNFLPPYLVKLILWGSRLVEDPMPILEKLPKRMGIGKPSLESKWFALTKVFLNSSLCSYGAGEWTVEAGAMPSICRLEISDCNKFVMVPHGLKFFSTLQELKARSGPCRNPLLLALTIMHVLAICSLLSYIFFARLKTSCSMSFWSLCILLLRSHHTFQATIQKNSSYPMSPFSINMRIISLTSLTCAGRISRKSPQSPYFPNFAAFPNGMRDRFSTFITSWTRRIYVQTTSLQYFHCGLALLTSSPRKDTNFTWELHTPDCLP